MYSLSDGLFAPRNQWYIAAWSSEVSRSPMERWILDAPVALYRKDDGEPVALEGRCPHRSFPLGRSRIVGDNIQCGYHGITFRPDGSCETIPSQVHVPKVCRVKSYPVVERWQWIWIWPGDPALADESKIPDHFEIGLTDPSFRCAGDSYNLVAGRYMLLHDNLFDLTHFGYLHQDTFGGDGAADQIPMDETGPDWIASRFEQRDIECPSYFAAMMNYQGRVNRSFGLKLYMPCLHVGGEEFYRVGPGGNDGELIGALRVYHGVTPATRTTSHYFFAAGRKGQNSTSGSASEMMAGLAPALAEDISATVHIEELISHYEDRPTELLLQADKICVLGRRIFEQMIRDEIDSSQS